MRHCRRTVIRGHSHGRTDAAGRAAQNLQARGHRLEVESDRSDCRRGVARSGMSEQPWPPQVGGGGDVVKPASGASRTSGFALGLMLVPAVIELFGVAFASAGFEEVADASPFGYPGTAIAAVLIA